MSKRVLRIGVIGCGGIAQMMHLPYLAKNKDRFLIAGLCDLSADLLAALGDRYRVPEGARFNNIHALLELDLDAVLVTTSGDHTPQVRAALQAGRHVFVEKPLCFSLAEADELAGLARAMQRKLMVGYMKRFDPAYNRARLLLGQMGELRYAQINTLHPEEEGYLNFQGIITAHDVSPQQFNALREQEIHAISAAVGDIPAYLGAEYTDVLLGSMIHDINAMRGLLGEPEKVLFAEHWPPGENPGGITTIFAYPGALRVVYTWIFLPKLRDYFQEIALMSSSHRLRLQFPSPYLRNFPTQLLFQHMQGEALVQENITVSYTEAFEQELLAFYDYVVKGIPPCTGAEDARADTALLQQVLVALRPQGLGGEAIRQQPAGG